MLPRNIQNSGNQLLHTAEYRQTFFISSRAPVDDKNIADAHFTIAASSETHYFRNHVIALTFFRLPNILNISRLRNSPDLMQHYRLGVVPEQNATGYLEIIN